MADRGNSTRHPHHPALGDNPDLAALAFFSDLVIEADADFAEMTWPI
jgi:hypothetical protein